MMQRDIHLTAEGLLYSLQFKPGDFGEIALVSGQPQRAASCLNFLENPVKNFTFFGYTFWTGTYKGRKTTVGNGGFYAPDTAFVTELLCKGGIKTLVRLGSCGALKEDIGIGDLIVADTSLRGDGVTSYYVDDSFIGAATKDLTQDLFDLSSAQVKTHKGPVWTTDALFKETKEVVNPIIEKGAIAVDMVTNPFFTIANIKGVEVAAVLSVSDNLITGQLGFSDIKFFDSQRKMIDVVFGLVEKASV
ncbi:MAG: hypothetical protein JSV34_00820 [Candidatus Omnitrophota bacterium]|nr:MAG: hypothetical protein JSV34_00820 [Candidatus Omnitrophota bacterium]